MHVSVLMPVLNARQTLAKTANSILNQNDCEFELIWVDNGSTDGSLEIAKTFAQNDSRVKIIYEDRKGISFALNTGLKYCTGKYIARIDADDLMLPGRLQSQMIYLNEHPEIGLVSGKVQYAGNEIGKGYHAYVDMLNTWMNETTIRQHRFIESPFAHPSVMFRNELIAKYGMYTEENIPEDYELWLRWMHRGVRMAKMDGYVIEWTDSPNRLSRQHKAYALTAFDEVRLNYLSKYILSLNLSIPVYIAGGGKLAKRKIQLLENKGVVVEGVTDLIYRSIPHKKFILWDHLPAPGSIFLVSLVSNRNAFVEIDSHLKQKGYLPEVDYILAS